MVINGSDVLGLPFHGEPVVAIFLVGLSFPLVQERNLERFAANGNVPTRHERAFDLDP